MITRLRRYIASLLVPVVFASSVLYPARDAQAVIPVVAPIAMSIYGAGGAILATDAFAAAATAIVGGIAMAAIFSIGGDNPVTVRIPLQSDQAKTESAMPAPAADSSVSATTKTQWCYSVPAGGGASAAPAGLYCGNAPGAACPGSFSTNNNTCYDNYWGPLAYSTPTNKTCPAGYTLSGSSCSLTSARQATSDSKVDYARSGSGYAALPDIDSAKGAGSRQMVGNSVQVWGRDSSGAPVVVTSGVDSNGNTTVQTQRGLTSAGGQSIVKSDTYVINGTSGAVQSAASTSAAGSIAFDSASGAPVVSTGAPVVPSDSPPFEIPKDYNREVTQQTIRDKTTISADKLTDLADKYKAGDLPQVVPFDSDAFNPLKPDPGQVSSWLSTLLSKIGLPAGGQCGNAVIESELFGKAVNLSFVSFCNALAPIINWFAWVLVVFGVWRGVNRVAGGPESLAEVR